MLVVVEDVLAVQVVHRHLKRSGATIRDVRVDPRAATGFARDVEAYERGRPQYPLQAIEQLAAEFGLTRASTVLDLAAGTGKLTRQLAPLAHHVIAVDASPAMLAELRRQVPAADARAGTAEAIPLPDASVDAVFVGQAFHWFRATEAFEEIARVLRPGGGLALMWNQARWTEAELPWVGRFSALVEPRRVAAGPFPSGDDRWKEVLEQSERFAPMQEAWFSHVHRIGIEDFLALVASWSWIANLPHAERGDLLAEIRQLAGEAAVLELPYATEVYWTWRVGD
jgi:ubiquinone/menaquinone biosynthesis C-methylase UbiE